MISAYLNQTITWKSKGSVNDCNEPIYSDNSIKARFEYKRKMIRNTQGQDIVSEARCYTKSAVKPDDIIVYDGKNWVVKTVDNIVDLFGDVSHYEAYL